MKWMKECPLLICVIASALVLSVVGVIGRGSWFKEYPEISLKVPALSSAVCEGGKLIQKSGNVFLSEIRDYTAHGESDGFTDAKDNDGKAGGDYMLGNDGAGDGIGTVGTGDGIGTVGTSIEPETDGVTDETDESCKTIETGKTGEGTSVITEEPVSPFTTVDDSYFDDALFIGDSRIRSLYKYADMSNATFYAETGLSIYTLFTKDIARLPGEKQDITVEEALTQLQFGKIYIMVGINEMGRGTVETYLNEYKMAVAHIRELQPNAIIYVQSIMKINESIAKVGDYITNTGIEERNAGLQQLADNENVFYIDENEVVCDENGQLISEYTFDGVHLQAVHVPVWKEFLYTHAVEK